MEIINLGHDDVVNSLPRGTLNLFTFKYPSRMYDNLFSKIVLKFSLGRDVGG